MFSRRLGDGVPEAGIVEPPVVAGSTVLVKRSARPMHAVSLWLGHTDLTTTARYLNADVGQLHALNDRLVPAAVRATA